MSQNATKPSLTRGQLKVLRAAQEAGLNRTITQVCEDAGINRRTFYRWLDKPHFKEAWDEVWRGSISRHLPSVVAAQIAQARKGNVSAARLIADMAGAIKRKHEHSGPEGGPIEHEVTMTDAERIARIAELLDGARARRDSAAGDD